MTAGERASHPPRLMGLADLTLFYLVTGVSLRWIATAAAAGPGAILVWIGGLLFFYLPLALTVADLSSRYPQEGGLYVWVRRAFGPTTGFMAGWSYVTSNLPFYPSLFYFDAANALYLGGDHGMQLRDSTGYFLGFALAGLALITILNIVGLRLGRWLHNLGALGMWLPALIVIVMGLIAWTRFGSATRFTPATMRLQLDVGHMLFWSSLVFAYAGCETASFMAGEIRDPRRTIPRALLISGGAVLVCYLAGTAAVLLALRPEQVDGMRGLVQAAAATAGRLGIAWLVPPFALLVVIGNLGAASGYLAASSRIPFAIGLDRMLPPAFGRMHPRLHTPHVAILAQGAVAALFAVLGQAGTSVRGAYDVLVSLTIVGAFVPFVLMFMAAIELRAEPRPPCALRLPGGAWTRAALAGTGLVTTCVAILLAAVPAVAEPDKPLAVAKVIGGTIALLALGWTVQALGTRAAARAMASAAIPR